MSSLGFREMRIWQEAQALAIEIYQVTDTFPKHELFTLTSQLRRAAISVPANIAEGKGRSSAREIVQFSVIARGPIYEVISFCLLATELKYISVEKSECLVSRYTGLSVGVNALITKIRS